MRQVGGFCLAALCLVAACLAKTDVEVDEGVLVVTKDNFDSVIQDNEFVLLEFCEYRSSGLTSVAPFPPPLILSLFLFRSHHLVLSVLVRGDETRLRSPNRKLILRRDGRRKHQFYRSRKIVGGKKTTSAGFPFSSNRTLRLCARSRYGCLYTSSFSRLHEEIWPRGSVRLGYARVRSRSVAAVLSIRRYSGNPGHISRKPRRSFSLFLTAG